MDPSGADPRLHDSDPLNDTFALFPLVFSTGPDGLANIRRDADVPGQVFRYRDTGGSVNSLLLSDPFVSIDWGNGNEYFGNVESTTGSEHIDNIYNHSLETSMQ